MSEKEFISVPKDERDTVAKLRAQLEAAELQQNQNEKFGKYDIATPNEGEDTYQSYIESRPANGIIRDGDEFRNTETGQFASVDEYESDKAPQATADYYYQLMEKNSNPPEEVQDYSSLGLKQLVMAMARAEKIGDKAASMEAQAAMSAKLDALAEAEGWKAKQKEEQADILLTQVLQLSGQADPRPVSTSSEQVSASNPESDVMPEVSAAEEVSPEVDTNEPADTEVTEEGEIQEETNSVDTLNDAVVAEVPEMTENSVDTLEDADIADVPEVTENSVDILDGAVVPEVPEASRVDTLDDAVIPEVPEVTESPVDTLDNAVIPDVPEVDTAKSKKERRREAIDNVLHPLRFLSSRFFVRASKHREAVNEMRMNGDEERYKKNQRLLLGATIGVAALAAAYIFRDQIGDFANTLSGGGSVADHAHSVGTTIGSQGNIHDIDKYRTPGSNPQIPEVSNSGSGVSPEVFSTSAHTVTTGEGWDQTFNEMHIPQSEWHSLLQKLLQTNDPNIQNWVYTMPNGDPGISHTGIIPDSVLKSVNNLR